MENDILRFSIPALVAVVGWFIAHQFNSYRDIVNRRRELRVQYLLEAYRKLESVVKRSNYTDQQKLDFESAIADIQLLGTPEQVNSAIVFAVNFKNGDSSKLGSLLKLLRQDLRKEVGLKGQVDELIVFRVKDKP